MDNGTAIVMIIISGRRRHRGEGNVHSLKCRNKSTKNNDRVIKSCKGNYMIEINIMALVIA